jgi:hypothetical protein
LKASRRAFTIEPEQSLEEKLAALIAIRSVGADPACLIDLCEDGDWVVERIPTADAAAQYPRYPRSMGTRKAGIICWPSRSSATLAVVHHGPPPSGR